MDFKNLIFNGKNEFHCINGSQLITGRFQLLTIQHINLIKNELNLGSEVIIQIIEGKKSSEDKEKNPFTFDERKEMFNLVFQDDIEEERIKIYKYESQYIPFIINNLEEEFNECINYFFCGEDRIEGYYNQFYKMKETSEFYNYFKNRKIEFHQYFRDINEDEEISQSKQRELLVKEDFINQKNYLPEELYINFKRYSNHLKQYIKECIEDYDFQDIEGFDKILLI